MVFSLLGYFVSMIMVLTAAVGVMIGLSNFSTSVNVRHYQRPVLERNATNSETGLFMSVPDTKAGLLAKNTEASSAVAPDENAGAMTTKPHKHKAIARNRNNYERPSFGMGYAEYSRQRPFSTW